MTNENRLRSQDVYDHLNENFESGSDVSVSYTTTSRNDPMFVLDGYIDRGRTFLDELHSAVNQYDPKTVKFSHTASGIHVSLIFDGDCLIGTPEATGRIDRVEQSSPKTDVTVNECSLCRQRVPDAYPPLRLRHPTSNPYKSYTTDTHYLCVECSPGHFDDVVRAVNAFGVTNGCVEQVLFSAQSYDDDTEWVAYDDVDNPYVADVVTFIESELLDA